ncbi:MAG: inositol monophosphatase family protein [Phycisphaerales bacterium JB037]
MTDATRAGGDSGVSAEIAARLEAALELAQAGGEITLEHFNTGALEVEKKRDGTPVTVADRACERFIRDEIVRRFPGDGVLGEEFGETLAADPEGCRWILDPIDGTKSFVHGVPLYGTLIGIERRGEIVAGVIRMPALEEVVYASAGGGAWWQRGAGEPVRARVSKIGALAEACVCTTSLGYFDDAGFGEVFAELSKRAGLLRGWSDCYAHLLVATGRAEAAVEPGIGLWDIAPMPVIMREAGGVYTDWNGRARHDQRHGISSNGVVLDEILELTRGRG